VIYMCIAFIAPICNDLLIVFSNLLVISRSLAWLIELLAVQDFASRTRQLPPSVPIGIWAVVWSAVDRAFLYKLGRLLLLAA